MSQRPAASKGTIEDRLADIVMSVVDRAVELCSDVSPDVRSHLRLLFARQVLENTVTVVNRKLKETT